MCINQSSIGEMVDKSHRYDVLKLTRSIAEHLGRHIKTSESIIARD